MERGNQLFWRGDRYRTNLSRSRAGNLPFYLLGMFVAFAWTRRLAGDAAATIAAALFAALPPVLAEVRRHLPNARPVPSQCTPGVHAVSEMMYLRERDGALRWLTRFEPAERAGASIRLYRIASCP